MLINWKKDLKICKHQPTRSIKYSNLFWHSALKTCEQNEYFCFLETLSFKKLWESKNLKALKTLNFKVSHSEKLRKQSFKSTKNDQFQKFLKRWNSKALFMIIWNISLTNNNSWSNFSLFFSTLLIFNLVKLNVTLFTNTHRNLCQIKILKIVSEKVSVANKLRKWESKSRTEVTVSLSSH